MFKDKLKELRARNNLTQRELAQKLNLSYGTIAMYETGKRSPDYDTLNKIADLFNVSTDFLLGRDSSGFGTRLKELREEKNLTRDALAKKLNISYSAVSKYETNVRFPDKETLRQLADFFNITLDFLLGRTDDPTSSKVSSSDKPVDIDAFVKKLKDKDGVMFHGAPADDLTRQAVLKSIENAIEMIETLKKKKKD